MKLEEMQKLPIEEQEQLFNRLNQARNLAKTVNFGCVYGAGPAKIAQSTGMSLTHAEVLHKTYWERNKAVKLVAKSCKVKTIKHEGEEQMWLFNPISKLWCSLRADKDRFSVINQSSGVFCFDLYVKFVREQGIEISLQMHDEIQFVYPKEKTEEIKEKLYKAIQKVNNFVKLNVPLGISIDIGTSYANVH